MQLPCDTKSAMSVELFVERTFAQWYPGADLQWLRRIFSDVEILFNGGHPEYSPIDLKYHDLEHSLQATVCLVLLLEGRLRARALPQLDARHFELAVASALLHDCGYLKVRSDTKGTGAKYTFCHVLRSCAFAASYLPTLGASDYDVETVLSAINCTGPATELSRLAILKPVQRIVGSALGTADYLAQMSAPGYLDKLEILYREFEESDDFIGIPRSRRVFASAGDLIARTPDFWHNFVLPKLETEFQAVYRFLAAPYPAGINPYLAAIENYITEIGHGTTGCASSEVTASAGRIVR